MLYEIIFYSQWQLEASLETISRLRDTPQECLNFEVKRTLTSVAGRLFANHKIATVNLRHIWLQSNIWTERPQHSTHMDTRLVNQVIDTEKVCRYDIARVSQLQIKASKTKNSTKQNFKFCTYKTKVILCHLLCAQQEIGWQNLHKSPVATWGLPNCGWMLDWDDCKRPLT